MNHLGAILCLVSCLLQRMLHGRMFDVIFRKILEESTKVVELALEGKLFIPCQKYNFKCKLTKGQHRISKLLTTPLLPDVVLIFSKHKWCIRKQTILLIICTATPSGLSVM